MICATCGRDNPSHLTFCQDCGARLAPRVAPPTPPIGLHRDAMGSVHPAQHAPAPPSTDAPPRSGDAPKPRPSAPEFSFAPRQVSEPAIEKPVEKATCPTCGTQNPPNLRFCNSCGTVLAAPAARDSSPKPIAPAAAPAPPPPPAPPPVPAAVAPAPPVPVGPAHAVPPAAKAPVIAPSPVVGIGPSGAPALTTVRVCSRCRGACDPNSQFCKFCGASLVDAATSSVPAAGAAPRPSTPSAQAAIAAIPAPASSPPMAPPTAPAFRPPSVPPGAAPFAPPPGAAPFGPPPGAAPAMSEPPPAAAASPNAAAARRSNPAIVPAPATGRASAPARGRLIVITKDGAEGATYPIIDQVDIGRDEGDVVVKDDRYLSPRHARITWKESDGGGLYLRDLGSVNGVFMRLPTKPAQGSSPGPGAHEAVLRDQDLILIGQQVIRFEVVKDAEEGLGPAVEHGTMVFGTPAGPRYARLCQRTVEGVTRDVYHLRKAETVLGRESGDIVFTEDPFLSRRHAAVRTDVAKRTFSLVDFGSSNGTFLQVRGEVALRTGDEFRVGQQLFRVVVG